MEETKLVLNQYQLEALKTAIESQIKELDNQINNLNKTKHLDNSRKKEIKRSLSKRKDLLKEILGKIN